ncbi:MAG: 7-carboxy-7-deazaguanine synthase QueE [Gammaproteobacteria bacterium]|nr:7-carboxy-7-deazaguanine synthase QueE [Gammaproteobacteria bacterium]|tara:strand:+ start:39 stop:686 length:648 start_codon:yes stop_codon:yes gene_type:complete
MNINTLRVTEIFHSIQGESTKTGLPTIFIRLTGCPLRCIYCDTEYAFTGGENLKISEIMQTIKSSPSQHICITGGEPLAQPNVHILMNELAQLDYDISLETSGYIDVSNVNSKVKIIMDIKTPESKEVDKNNWENINLLKNEDEVKFVICNRNDYEWSKEIMEKYMIYEQCNVLMSPVADLMEPRTLAEWILEDSLPVRFQIQLHKILWDNQPGK